MSSWSTASSNTAALQQANPTVPVRFMWKLHVLVTYSPVHIPKCLQKQTPLRSCRQVCNLASTTRLIKIEIMNDQECKTAWPGNLGPTQSSTCKQREPQPASKQHLLEHAHSCSCRKQCLLLMKTMCQGPFHCS